MSKGSALGFLNASRIEFNDLFSQHEELRKRNQATRDIYLRKMENSLRNSQPPNKSPLHSEGLAPQSSGRGVNSLVNHSFTPKVGLANLNRGVDSASQGPAAQRIGEMIKNSLLKNFSACCDCISSMHEFDLAEHIRRKLDQQIDIKLKEAALKTNLHAQKDAFWKAFQEKAKIETDLEAKCLAMEKKLVQGRTQLSIKQARLSNKQAETLIRQAQRQQRLAVNTKVHMQANIEEIDYIYKNDKQSLLDDSQKYLASAGADITRYAKELDGLADQVRAADRQAVEKYRQLRQALSQGT